MDLFLTYPVSSWLIIGVVLAIFEFFIPGFIIFFFALGAWLTALLSTLFDLSFPMQLIAFSCSSVIFLFFFRKYAMEKIYHHKSLQSLDDEFIGQTTEVFEDILPHKPGKVTLKGSVWTAKAEHAITAGTPVIIIDKDNLTLIVEAV